MADIPNKIQIIISEYLAALSAHGFQIEDANLFGSYAKGNANQWSDIDLAVVSNEFDGVRFTEKTRFAKSLLQLALIWKFCHSIPRILRDKIRW
ncbi:MAG: nucleotidyltransferase domain-containing protein [Chloroflexi bacterium]|nr:nucleotidyltransferase domain-containing protein [Chloroflexota bacterium]